MIVLDASVVVELLTNGALADSIRSDLSRRDESFIVPHLIDVEVMSALRRLVAGRWRNKTVANGKCAGYRLVGNCRQRNLDVCSWNALGNVAIPIRWLGS